ncbi:hypothetical protein [Novispirillum itersonii]|uniref:Uncharacterized protein n=1 Tax=Novispirillum itersonii TaxID=189 RepID=A0A7W9ZL82_NOVIT|nr:hypothetical protein [Novispirillum itersonii]MBB6212289.1 hypothetical protein [Novispirillum itersonii]
MLIRERRLMLGKSRTQGLTAPAHGASTKPYQPLFTVRFRHDYYNGNERRCPDFQVMATPSTVTVLKTIGLAVQDFGTGFSISCPAGLLPSLIAYIERVRKVGEWPRLSFALVCTNPAFVGITELPLSFNPARENLYFTNRQAHQEHGLKDLQPGRRVTAASIKGVLPQTIDVKASPDLIEVQALDIAGQAVVTAPGPAYPSSPPGTGGTGGTVSVDFIGQAEGLYQLCSTYDTGLIRTGPWKLRTIASPLPMCFLDLLLCPPTPGAAGMYPITRDGDQVAVTPLDLELKFAARRSWWVYYVVPQGRGGGLSALQITGTGASFQQASPVILPTGDCAIPFWSDRRLPLSQQPEQRFQLSGQRDGPFFVGSDVSVTSLPLAPPAPVWPGQNGPVSEIYVYV